MVNFFAPLWLLGLLFTPLFYLVSRRKQKRGLIAPHLQKQPALTQNKVAIYLSVAWVLYMFALSGPHWREQDRPQSELERARVIVMDMSQSMYVTDITPTRFQQAFYKMTDLIQQLDGGYTGLVAYSGHGYTIIPLTHDHNTLLSRIEHLSPEVMPSEGKNAAVGVAEAIALLDQAQFGYGDILLVTSGISAAEASLIDKLLMETHYTLSTYAISTVQGGEVVSSEGIPMLDASQQPIISKLVPERLSDLADFHSGISVTYQHSQRDIERLYSYLQDLRSVEELTESSQGLSTQFINDGYWLLWPIAIILLMAFRRGVIWSLGIVLLLPVPEASAVNIVKNSDRQGYDLYVERDYQQAVDKFDDSAWRGAAYYEMGNYQQAVEELSRVSDGSSDYNLANALAKLGQLEEAIEKYRQVLDRDPSHQGAEINLAVVEAAAVLAQSQEAQESSSDESSGEGDSNEEEQGESEGDEEREEQSENESGGDKDNIEFDPDSENVPEQQGMSEQSGASDPNGNGSEQPSEEEGGELLPSEQQFGESGDYEPDRFTHSGSGDLDVGEPSEDDLEAMRQQLSELGEVDPVLNRLTQVEADPSLLLRNLLLLQQEQKPSSQHTEIEW